MASQRKPSREQSVCYRVVDSTGRVVYVGGTKSAASAWRNRQTKNGTDTRDWTLEPVK